MCNKTYTHSAFYYLSYCVVLYSLPILLYYVWLSNDNKDFIYLKERVCVIFVSV